MDNTIKKTDADVVVVTVIGENSIKSVMQWIRDDNMKKLGIVVPKEKKIVNSVEITNCATCGKEVPADYKWKDELSKNEWNITEICASCQDITFRSYD